MNADWRITDARRRNTKTRDERESTRLYGTRFNREVEAVDHRWEGAPTKEPINMVQSVQPSARGPPRFLIDYWERNEGNKNKTKKEPENGPLPPIARLLSPRATRAGLLV